MELKEFLAEAKKRGYAGGKPVHHPDGAKRYYHSDGKHSYTDTYYGHTVDCGQELVYLNQTRKVIWMMSYRGGLLSTAEEVFKEEIFGFLRECLLLPPPDFPVRGPKTVVKDNLLYSNVYHGTFESFSGVEAIYQQGIQVAFRDYFGGLVD
jgi:hypothetical protein